MASGDPESDVAAGLSELECKLRELERAFSTLGHEYDGRPTEPPPEDHLAPVPPATDAPADAPAPEPDDRIEELARTQARLSATLEALQADVSRLVDGLAKPPPGAPQAPSAAAPPPPPPPAPPPPPIPPIHPLPLQRAEEPVAPPEPRSIRDYAPNPPATRPPADDGA